MLDEQKVVYEEILDQARASCRDGQKRVILVKGGPGTGKSVVAVNLLVQLTGEEQYCQYISKNSAPRYVASVYKGQHAPNRVISVIFCVILNRRTSSTPLSSALKITEIPAVGVFES